MRSEFFFFFFMDPTRIVLEKSWDSTSVLPEKHWDLTSKRRLGQQ
jgi:hypothetical protein